MSSIEPNDGCDELNGSEEVAPGLVVAGGDGAKLLEPGEEVLDQMASFEEVAIIVTARLPIGPWWDDCHLAGRSERPEDALIGVKRLVGDQRVGLHAGQEMIGTDEIMRLTAGQEEADGVSQRIDQGMDLGAQTAAGSADRLILVGFFCAPALC